MRGGLQGRKMWELQHKSEVEVEAEAEVEAEVVGERDATHV